MIGLQYKSNWYYTFIISKADKFPIGKQSDSQQPFTLQTVELRKDDMVYMFTDGYADQFSGPSGKKLKYKALKETLMTIHKLPMTEQKKKLYQTFENWKGKLEQVDDVLLIGVRV